MIEIGMLVRWKPQTEHWGYYYRDKPKPYIQSPIDAAFAGLGDDDGSSPKIRFVEPELLKERDKEATEYHRILMAELKKNSKNPDGSDSSKAAFKIYRENIEKLDEKYQLDNYPYGFITVEKLFYHYKLGGIQRKGKNFWKVLFTSRAGKTQFFWVEEGDIEPAELGGYDPKKKLLAKFLERKKLKVK
jgi:hypothetical protein